MNKTITHSTPAFTITPTPGVYLTMDAGPTYVIYNTFFGGLDESNDRIHGHKTVRSCGNPLTSVEIEAPTKTEDWSYFIATYTDQAPSPVYDQPLALPTKLIDFLKLDTDIQEQFLGSDIATCTLRPTPTPSLGPGGPGSRPPAPAIPGFPSVTTGTFISTSYASTSTHVTRQGCLRCDNLQPSVPLEPTPKVNGGITDGDGYIASPGPTPQPNQNNPDPSPKASSNNKPNDKPNTNHNDDPNIISNNNPNNNDNPNNHPKPNAPSNPANIPDLLASIINNQPTVWPQHTQGPSITIGDDVFPINKPKQTQYNDNQHDSDLKIPIIVIGTNTLKPGETRTINGVPVVAPTNGGASQIIVNGHTVAYNFPPSPTGPPVLTVGQNTVTANPQGQFIFGTATLKPGGPAVILAGSTFSLAPGGPIAIINGVTQTLHNAPAPTAAPALTLANGQIIPITTVNNQPAYVLAPDQTLLPGSALTVSGTTYSLPASGSGTIVVINGQTSTIASPADAYVTAAPVLTINGQTYPATVVDGTTQYEIAPGTTLRPGEAVTMGGTTYSLDTAGTALVVDGQTSRISLSRVPASTSASTTGSRSTSTRGMGDLIASGIGEGRGSSSSSRAAGARGRGFSLDGWIESVIMGVAGWMVWLL
ncbi:hypothetical protein NX059_008515 [Plenodomus lindquistii]|nr:hypothetical protein NX059_008515 [Plenodomus lindquistii]